MSNVYLSLEQIIKIIMPNNNEIDSSNMFSLRAVFICLVIKTMDSRIPDVKQSPVYWRKDLQKHVRLGETAGAPDGVALYASETMELYISQLFIYPI